MNDNDLKRIIEPNVTQWVPIGSSVLVVVPDTTRTIPLARLMNILMPVLQSARASVTVLVALGTHPPLPQETLRNHLGPSAFTGNVRVMNHAWDDPDSVISIDKLSAEEVHSLSGGLLQEEVDLRVNKAITKADCIIFMHTVFPHELVGFSGGSKYIFPGISGPEMIDILHWLGALRTSGKTIGQIDTPSRRIIDAAAKKIPVPMYGLSLVHHSNNITALEAGELTDAWTRAAKISQKVHVVYKPAPFQKVLACCPSMYPDLWTGGKCVYKCEPVVADGGELIVYAPHVKTFSEVHESNIRALGYHVRDYFLQHMDKYAHLPRSVMAYCSIVKGDGTYKNNIETPRIKVSFASQIPKEVCETAGIGYVDPASIKIEDWINREHEGILVVDHAGEMLYRVATS